MKEKILFTEEGLHTIIQERDSLITLRPSIVTEVTRGAELGDRSENGLYKGAKMKLGQIDSRIRFLTRLISSAHVPSLSSHEHVVFGSYVTLKNDQKIITYRIVGIYESNPSQSSISYQSPLGSLLMGKHVGDTVLLHTLSSHQSYTIIALR